MVHILDEKELKGCSPKFSINSAREKEPKEKQIMGVARERSYQRPPEILPPSMLARSARGAELEFPLITVATRYQRTIKSATLCLIVHAMPFLFFFDTRILVLMLTCRIRPVNPSWLGCFICT